jgi:hypothetical protein
LQHIIGCALADYPPRVAAQWAAVPLDNRGESLIVSSSCETGETLVGLAMQYDA